MIRHLWLVAISSVALVTAACDDDDGGGTGNGGSAGSTSSSSSGSNCPGAEDCTTYCTSIETEATAQACPNDDPYDLADCIATCQATFDMFEAAQSCVCEYHASLACPMNESSSCYECGVDGTWQNTDNCCTDEVTAVQDCASAL